MKITQIIKKNLDIVSGEVVQETKDFVCIQRYRRIKENGEYTNKYQRSYRECVYHDEISSRTESDVETDEIIVL